LLLDYLIRTENSKMSNKHTSTDIEKTDEKVSIREIVTDSPLLPVELVERLHKIDPTLATKVFELTEAEGQFRRSETKRINTLAFIQRFLGQFFAFMIGMSSIIGGVWLVSLGHAWAGASIVGCGLTGLAVAFIKGRAN
jgi:uncharacterized membrane protein